MSFTIRALPESGRVALEGSGPAASRWSFVDSYAGVVGLGQRIEGFLGFDENGKEIPIRRIAPGQFEAQAPAIRFQYEVNLAPPNRAADAAMVSWLSRDRAILNLADLLPVNLPLRSGSGANLKIGIKLPNEWLLYTTENQAAPNEFAVADPARAVFAIGSHLRRSEIKENGLSCAVVIDGEWSFSDAEAVELAGKALRAHREMFGAIPAKRAMLVLFPFPQLAPSQWSAETKGTTVTLLMGKTPSKNGALAQLSTPLTHELFHLWVPNGLTLGGDYDWFYEGFTVYEAARAAVRLDLLTFPEFLSAVARAFDAANSQNSLSLIESSGRRWTTGQAAVYAKSMVVAFLYDLRLRSASHGKKSLETVYRTIFRTHAAGADGSLDGNEAATQALGLDAPGENFVRQFIRNPVTINLASELAPFGLQVETIGLRTRIAVNERLNKQQRDLLREMGYNDVVRVPRP